MARSKDLSNSSPTYTSSDGKTATVSKSGGSTLSAPEGTAVSLNPGSSNDEYYNYFADGGVAPPPAAPAGPTPEQIAAENAARLEAAYQRALGYGTEQVKNRGFNQGLVDQYGVIDAYKAMLDQRKGELDPSHADPYSQFGVDNYFNNAVQNTQSRYQSDLRNQIVGAGGDGFEYQTFADTADDPILQGILDRQKGDAQLILDRAKARGQLNDVGYGRAQTELGTQGSGAMATLQSIGGGVLEGYRKQLRNTYDQGLNQAATASFAQPFNAGSIVDRLNQLKTGLSGSLENDINKGVGGTTFYTPSVAIGKGGTTQGTINPSKINFKENPLLAAFQTDENRKQYGATNTGSTANTGAF